MVTKRKAGKAAPKKAASKKAAEKKAASKKAAPKTAAKKSSAAHVDINSDAYIEQMLEVLQDKSAKVDARLDALQSLQAATFSVITFEPHRGEYIAALRSVADDKDPEIRRRVLGILARENDGFAQKRLMDGLKDPSQALVPPEKALQLLSYDVHAGAYDIARKIAAEPPNPTARREALRVLAADANSAPLFEKLLRDKSEMSEIRQLSAAALQSLKPDELQKAARDILLDKSDYDEIKATSLSALTHFGNESDLAADTSLQKHVDQLSKTASKKIKPSAKQFLAKYRG
jgi:hypothetical protein